MTQHDELNLPRRRPLGGYAVAVIVIAILAVAIGAVIYFVTRDRPVTTPSLLGLTLAEAVEAADGSGLGLVVAGGDAPGAVVVSQDPAPGSETNRGTVVAVSLALPPQPTEVPDLTGKTRPEAEALLAAVGLYVGALHEVSSDSQPPGSIVRQNPLPGTEALTGSTIDLWIAGVGTAVTPDLLGLTEDQARAAVQEAGLSIRFLGEVTDEVLPGLVFEQSPIAGESVPAGSVVVAIVNAAPGQPGDGPDETAGGPPDVYRALSRQYSLPVLYPTALPDTLVLQEDPDNPGYRVGPGGTQGFEVAYTDPDRPDVRVSIYEGNWFDPGLDDSTTVDVRGFAAAAGPTGDRWMIVWSENDTMYAVSAIGVDAARVLEIAQGLLPVSSP
jgi:beta-lactam-binding protein with PASTA domain